MQRTPLYPVTLVLSALCGLLLLWLTLDAPAMPTVQAARWQQESTSVPTAGSSPPDAATEIKVTVGTLPNVCAPTNAITVSKGATIYYCYSLENKSNYTLTTHSLTDLAIGLRNHFTLTMTPSGGMTPAHEIPGFAHAFQPIQSTVTWVATSTNNLTFTAQSQFQVNMPTLALTATVGVDPQGCGATAQLDVVPGTQVYYCYQLRNSGAMTLTIPQIAEGGGKVNVPLPLVLTPGVGVNFTATNLITQTTERTISLTGYTLNGLTTFVQAKTTVQAPAFQLRATVGLTEECATTTAITVPMGTQVYYCYKLINFGGIPFTNHRIMGSTIAKGMREITFTLPLTANVLFPTPVPITDTRVHTISWLAWNADNFTATASAQVATTALTTLTVEVFYDVNGANNRDKPLEPTLPSTLITLSYPNGVPITATTNLSGLITLRNIPARVYTAVFTQPRLPNAPYVPSTGSATRQLDLRNRAATHALFGFTLLPPIDDDGDGIPNQFEGAGDEDGDGIPNYLDYSPKVFVAAIRRVR